MSKSFKELFSDIKQRDSYWVEKAVLEFTCELYDLMVKKNITKAEMARTIGTSPAYITKVFSGNANFTVETMVRLTRALGGQVHIHIADENHIVKWYDAIDGSKKEESSWTTDTTKGMTFHERIRVAAR